MNLRQLLILLTIMPIAVINKKHCHHKPHHKPHPEAKPDRTSLFGTTPNNQAIVVSGATPFDAQFPDNVLQCGQRVFISGVPKGDFTVNFNGANGDWLFHFDVRFASAKWASRQPMIARNTMINGKFDFTKEERGGPFPFVVNNKFALEIVNEPKFFQVHVNGNFIHNYNHRTPNPCTDYKILKILGQRSGNVELTSVDVGRK